MHLPNRWIRTDGPTGCCCWPRDKISLVAALWAAGVWRSETLTWTRSCRSWCHPAHRWASGRPLRHTRHRVPSATSPRTNRATTTTSAGASLSANDERSISHRTIYNWHNDMEHANNFLASIMSITGIWVKLWNASKSEWITKNFFGKFF